MKSLKEDLKNGQLNQVYLLCGEEAYLKKYYKNELRRALVSPDDTMNYAYFEGKGIDVGEVIGLAETLPFFSERRLIILEDTGLFKSSGADLADYLKEMPETTYMVFVDSDIDKRAKLYKAVQSKGRVVELNKQDENTLSRWVKGTVNREGKQMDDGTIRHFLEKVGMDMENIQKELEKLLCYTLERNIITRADIEEICTEQISNRVFDMVEAVAAKEQRKALDYYYDLLALKEPPLRILYLLSRQFKLLMEVKAMGMQGLGKKEIAEKAGIHPNIVWKYENQAKAFQMQTLREIIEDGVETEEDIKTGKLTEIFGVELFIMKYSRRDA